MHVENHEHVGRALTLLRDGLTPYIEQKGTAFYADRWNSEVQRILGSIPLVSGRPKPTQDLAAQLLLVDRLWGTIFGKALGRFERSLVNELRDVRNRWAHQDSFSEEDADRALDSAARLLTAISAPQASEVQKLRAGLRQPSEEKSHERRKIEIASGYGISGPSKSGHRQRILEFVRQYPGKDDDQIASALSIRPRQTVNMICRKLCDEKVLRRQRGGRGKLVNFVANEALAIAPDGPAPDGASGNVMSEDRVKSVLEGKLRSEGWSVKVAWGRQRGIDIEALRAGERWVIECKGEGSLPPMQNNYFVGAVGELLQRMSDADAKHSIAFPDRPKFRRLWVEFPASVKERLKLSALFVSDAGNVIELAT